MCMTNGKGSRRRKGNKIRGSVSNEWEFHSDRSLLATATSRYLGYMEERKGGKMENQFA